MKNENQKPAPVRNTSLYFQLGLVASLFLAYFVLELETEKKTFEDVYKREAPIELSQKDFDHRILIEKQPEKVETKEAEPLDVPKITEHFEITKNDAPEPEITKKIVYVEPELENSIYDVPKVAPTPKVHEMATLDMKPTFMACAHLKGEKLETNVLRSN